MPQIVLEHSANLKNIDYQHLFAEIYAVINKLPNTGTCKMRAIAHKNYYIGAENGENAFAYLKVSLKPAKERADPFRENLAKNLIPILKKYLDPIKKVENIKCYPTVEISFLSDQYYWIEE
jgi:5-carboxymethyl-2-hydroxymuconate isomerase